MTYNSTFRYGMENTESNDPGSDLAGSPETHLRYHFTKTEERELKKAKRRIKNKLSAQESRKRKKEYIEGLERKMRQKDRDNSELQARVFYLEQRVAHLTNEVRDQHKSRETATTQRPSNEDSSAQFPVSVRHISRSTQTGICLDCFGRYEDRRAPKSPISDPGYIECRQIKPWPTDVMQTQSYTNRNQFVSELESRQARPKSLDLKKQSFSWSCTSSGSNQSEHD